MNRSQITLACPSSFSRKAFIVQELRFTKQELKHIWKDWHQDVSFSKREGNKLRVHKMRINCMYMICSVAKTKIYLNTYKLFKPVSTKQTENWSILMKGSVYKFKDELTSIFSGHPMHRENKTTSMLSWSLRQSDWLKTIGLGKYWIISDFGLVIPWQQLANTWASHQRARARIWCSHTIIRILPDRWSMVHFEEMP